MFYEDRWSIVLSEAVSDRLTIPRAITSPAFSAIIGQTAFMMGQLSDA